MRKSAKIHAHPTTLPSRWVNLQARCKTSRLVGSSRATSFHRRHHHHDKRVHQPAWWKHCGVCDGSYPLTIRWSTNQCIGVPTRPTTTNTCLRLPSALVATHFDSHVSLPLRLPPCPALPSLHRTTKVTSHAAECSGAEQSKAKQKQSKAKQSKAKQRRGKAKGDTTDHSHSHNDKNNHNEQRTKIPTHPPSLTSHPHTLTPSHLHSSLTTP